MTFQPGSRLGPYEIVAPLGAGGMGEVFRARDTRLGRTVALKVLPPLFSTDPDRLRRFEQEARAAAALNHPNILVVHDVSTDAAGPFVVSELLEGQTLRQVVEAARLPARKAVDYGIQIANGLAAAHEKGIVHRDLKPENLFVTKDGRVKILDFGLAKLAEEVSSDGSRATVAHTDPGMVVGTMGYMSPEQLRGEPVDARSDVFSLGAVLYELFSGERAFKGKTAVDTMSAILREDPPEFPPAIRAASPALERIVRRCLEKSREERFESARDVMFALDALSTASGPGAAIPQIEAAPRRRWLRAAALAAAGVLGAAAMYGLGTRAGEPPDPPALSQLTFRNGTVRGARFSPDGKSVVYAAAWEGEPLTLYTTREGRPESSPLPLPSADLLAMSRTGEMALALTPRFAGPFAIRGTLARAGLAGGAARALMEDVSSADWSPDGSSMAAIRAARNRGRLEYPLGTERVTTPYWLSDVRVSPNGEDVAFVAHPGGGDDGEVQVVGRTGAPRTISKGWMSVQGLAWAREGRELWFTGTRKGMLRALWAVTLDGRERLLYRAPTRLTLQDVAPDGRVLLVADSLRTQVFFGSIRDRTLRSLSWFDWATSLSLSADGRLLSFTESGEGAGTAYGLFVRPTDGGPATRIADGPTGVISPDGRWVLSPGDAPGDVRIIPTGAGTTRTVSTGLAVVDRGDWYPDGSRAILAGAAEGRTRRSYELDLESGRVTPITPEGRAGLLVSPDGQWLIVGTGRGREIYHLATGTARPLTAGDDGDILGWSADSAAIYAMERDDRGTAGIYRVTRATGARTLALTLKPDDPAGSSGVNYVALARDGDHFAYTTTRTLSGLFVVQLPAR